MVVPIMFLSTKPTNTIYTKHNKNSAPYNQLLSSNTKRISINRIFSTFNQHSSIQTFQDEITKSQILIAHKKKQIFYEIPYSSSRNLTFSHWHFDFFDKIPSFFGDLFTDYLEGIQGLQFDRGDRKQWEAFRWVRNCLKMGVWVSFSPFFGPFWRYDIVYNANYLFSFQIRVTCHWRHT